jgi:1,6-anhydro-N-acetylmuramate kinase
MRLLSDGTKQFDKDGELGAKGEADIDETFVDEFLASEPYFDMKLPKTTGRELFSDDVAKGLVSKLRQRNKSTEAIVATITRITAESIARAYEQFILPLLQEGSTIDEIYLCGGGAHNPNIFNHLKSRFLQSRVMKLDEAPFKLDPSAKEAVLFALLGYLAVCGRRIPLAADAETKDPAILGVVTPGANYSDVMKAIVADEEFGSWSTLGRIIM